MAAAGEGTPSRIAPFGPAAAAALLLGALVTLRLPTLPPSVWPALALPLGLILWSKPPQRWLRLIGVALVGFAWAALHGQWALDTRLPPELAGQDLRLEIVIDGLPERHQALVRFDARVLAGEGAAADLVGRRLRLSWYGAPSMPVPGEHWRLTARLKRPRGTLNPGGFDYERRALERRLAATGYVRDSASAERLAGGAGVGAWRARTSERIATAVPGPGARFVQALALGDTRGLGERDWEVLRATGLTHLIAISGFHVGLVAGFGALLIGGVWRLFPRLGRHWPRPQAAALGALLAALGYAAVAGFALPTVRTVLMIAAALLARLLRRPHATGQAFALALIALLLADPLAVLGPGFWLSFAGVAWLLWCLPRDPAGGKLKPFLSAQAVATLGLLPFTVWFFGQASLAGPLVNLLGIPWISLGVVPLSLIGLGLDALAPSVGAPVLRLAALSMQAPWPWLERIADWHGALIWLPEPSLAATVLALFGAFWLLLPRGVPGKPLALLLWLPMLWPAQERLAPGELDLALIDVGQGLSVLVRSADHALLYDAGPAYAGGLDLGEAAVLPALRAQGVARLDAFVIGHGDNDHAGGAAAIRRAYAPEQTFAPEGWADSDMRRCQAGTGWDWDGVRFRFLHPPVHFPYLGNESSCVLRIESAHGTVLLPGDIGAVVERRLVREQAEALAADVVVVPHHGSRGSSSPEFVAAVRPRLALIAAGHGNRFGLPKAEVLARWRAAGADLDGSAEAGFLRVRLDAGGPRLVERRRDAVRRFWHEPGDASGASGYP